VIPCSRQNLALSRFHKAKKLRGSDTLLQATRLGSLSLLLVTVRNELLRYGTAEAAENC